MRRYTCFAVAPGLKVSQQTLHCNKLNFIDFTCYYFKLCGSSYIKSKSSPSFLHWKTCLHSCSSKWSSTKWLMFEEKQKEQTNSLKHFFYLMQVCCIFSLCYTQLILKVTRNHKTPSTQTMRVKKRKAICLLYTVYYT